MQNWCVLFVKTGCEEKVISLLQSRFIDDTLYPFTPLREIMFKRAGQVVKEREIAFPGYVFINSNMPAHELFEKIKNYPIKFQDIYKILSYDIKWDIYLRESEKMNILQLCNEGYCIESSVGIIEGDKIQIISGPLQGKESTIIKVNRHKREAIIMMDIMGEARKLTVGIEIITKVR